MHWAYYAGRGLTRILLFLLTNWQVKGRGNIPEGGPMLIVCNHINLADPPIVALSVRRRVVFMAKEELFRGRWSRFWVQNFGAFPVRRGVLDRRAFRQAEYWIKQGVPLIMFPEGKRSSNSQLQPALPGSALIASRLDVPILPVSISGSEKVGGPNWLLQRPRITVNIGKPYRLPQVDGKLTRAELTRLTSSIMERIAELLPPEYRGVYAKKGENAEDRESQ